MRPRYWLFALIIMLVAVLGFQYLNTASIRTLETFDGSAGQDSVAFPLTPEDLSMLPDTGYIGRHAQNIRAKLPGFEAQMQQLGNASNDIEIDVVLQVHLYDGMPDNLRPAVAECQKKILHYLNDHQYDVVLVEGETLDTLSVERILNDQIRVCAEIGTVMTRTRLDAWLQENLPYYAGLQYMMDHPDRHVAGAEDEDMVIVHYEALHGPYGFQPNDPINQKLLRLRSIIPLARTCAMLQKVHGKRAVLIIGASHGQPIRELMHAYGIRGRIMDASGQIQT